MPDTLDIETVRKQVELFLVDTMDARDLSEKCRDYYDHKQWTEAEAAKLKARNQAPIVVNRIRPKVRGLVGLYDMRKSDPKAYPRTQKHEKSAYAITDGVRYVADNNDFGEIRKDVADEFFVEGYGGAAVVVRETRRGEIEIVIDQIPWDRIYFDPHSRRKDYKDARYLGFYMWMYSDEAKEKFPDADIDQLIADSNFYTDETTEDRPRWVDKQRDRIRVAVHFCMHESQWYMSVFTDGQFLVNPEVSPYLDEEGEPTCPIELVAANIDRDNQRYGEVAGFLDQQDEINHRRSKFLHLLNERQTHGRQGAVPDVSKLKREMAKPDGHVEWQGEEWGKDFGIIPTNDKMRGQADLYQDAKSELDSVSFNAQLAGARSQGAQELSGRAIEKLQAAGTVELNQDYSRLAGWEKRIYRQIWERIKQYWDSEKWIRVTDDQDSLRWVGLNARMTARDWLEEKINDESLPIPERRKAAASYQALISAEAQKDDMRLAEIASARLEQIVGVRNPVPELDVDIILDQSFDTINIQQEQFQMLAQFASSGDIDIVELIELSQLRGKDELIDKIERRRAQQSEQQGNVADAQAKKTQAEGALSFARAQEAAQKARQIAVETSMSADEKNAQIQKILAEAGLKGDEAMGKQIENMLQLANPDTDPQAVT